MPELLDAAIRLVKLPERPQDLAVLGPMVKREILYRLLRSDQATKLQQMPWPRVGCSRSTAPSAGSSSTIAAFAIETVAAEARMSPSALHLHFKAVTAMSPLQYQKQLRLQEARRLMLSEALDAATAGHRVGYDSPSREYVRGGSSCLGDFVGEADRQPSNLGDRRAAKLSLARNSA